MESFLRPANGFSIHRLRLAAKNTAPVATTAILAVRPATRLPARALGFMRMGTIANGYRLSTVRAALASHARPQGSLFSTKTAMLAPGEMARTTAPRTIDDARRCLRCPATADGYIMIGFRLE